MHRFRKIASAVATGAVLLGFVVPVNGQTPPATDPDPLVQLAAVTPGAEDLPTGYAFVGETFLSADQVSGPGIDAATLDEGGFVAQYVSVYENESTDQRIRAYASLWDDDALAEAGFALLEDETATNPNDALEDTGAEVGEDPRETTVGSYLDADGTTVGTADVTFRRGPMVIGVAHETLDGSEADQAIATDLATRIDERAQAVLNGESPSRTDLTLPASMISFAAEGNGLVQTGFLGPVEIESIYGVQGSLLGNTEASWIETTLIGSQDIGAPTVTIGLTTFGSADDARLTAEQAADLFGSLDNQQDVEAPAIEGADHVTAFAYSSNGDSQDSFRLIYSAGTNLTVIDVQNAASEGGAEGAATAIAVAQMACQTGGTCEAPTLPAEFTGQ
jgi:hypothetical protein